MRFSLYTVCLVLAMIAFLEVNAAKDPLKRKLLKKAEALSQAKNLTESTEETNKNSTVVETESAKKNDSSTTFSITIPDEILDEEVTDLDKADEGSKDVAKPKPGLTFIAQFRELLFRFLGLLGLVQNTRKHRGLEGDDSNSIEVTSYREEVKTTVGAVLGKPDCIKKAACRAGKYLKGFKGKEILIVILEKITPTKWTETVRMVKDSAIYNDDCHYKCLED